MKKTLRLLTVMILVIMAGSLVMLGCANPADGAAGQPGKAGEGGEKGTDGPTYLPPSVTTAAIQDAIDSGVLVVFAGVTQSDAGTVIIRANNKVKLVGAAAYTVNDDAAAFLIIEDASSFISGTGGIVTQAAGTVIADQAVLDARVTGTGKLAYQTIGEGGIVGASPVAIKGDVSITDTGATGTAIKASELSGKELYVVGDLTVSTAVTATAINVIGDVTAAAKITAKLNVTGKATFTAAQDALTGLTAGSVESSVTITGGTNANITVTGELKTTGTANVKLLGTGTLTAGSLDLAKDLTVGAVATDAVTVKGEARIAGVVTNGAAASVFTFNGPTTIDTFTSGNAATVIAGTGSVTITEPLTDTSTNTVIIKNTGGVTLTAANVIAANLTATKATIKGTSTTGVIIKSAADDITVPANGSIDVTAEGALIEAGGTNGKVAITKAKLNAGTYKGIDNAAGTLTLIANTSLEVADGGAVKIANAGQISFGAATTSKIILLPGGALDLSATATMIKTGDADATGITISATDASDSPTKGAITGDAPNYTLTKADSGTTESVKVGNATIGITNDVITTISLTAASPAAAGKITAGTDTKLIFAGTN
jgi:hypothetical protein